jgi:hypothetical protein
MVLSVCICWFHSMVTLPPRLVPTDFGKCSYQCYTALQNRYVSMDYKSGSLYNTSQTSRYTTTYNWLTTQQYINLPVSSHFPCIRHSAANAVPVTNPQSARQMSRVAGNLKVFGMWDSPRISRYGKCLSYISYGRWDFLYGDLCQSASPQCRTDRQSVRYALCVSACVCVWVCECVCVLCVVYVCECDVLCVYVCLCVCVRLIVHFCLPSNS